jgi:hypothetical protein
VQFAPDAPTLLAAIGALLDEQVLRAVPADLQHQVRVAGHLARLVERELRLGPAADDRERELLGGLLDDEAGDGDDLVGAVATRLRERDDPAFERAAWPVLVEIARLDLAVAKPGHDAWEGT